MTALYHDPDGVAPRLPDWIKVEDWFWLSPHPLDPSVKLRDDREDIVGRVGDVETCAFLRDGRWYTAWRRWQ